MFVACDGEQIVAAAGYRPWLDRIAHIGVVTRTGFRGQGLAKVVSAAAAAHAQAGGLVPQWRAREDNTPSRAVAVALGFTELGVQVSFRL